MKNQLSQISFQIEENGLNLNSSEARKWLAKKVRELKLNPYKFSRETFRYRENTYIGKMYFFFYDPKTKETLSFYDRFPLAIPIERYDNGFLGINLHYVEPKIRIKILDKLMNNLTNKSMDETTKMRINYEILLKLATANFMKPCIKRYLYKHIESRFMYIEPTEWKLSCLLPFELFEKQPKRKVFTESRNQF